MNINDFYNKKCADLGYEDFGDFIGDSITDDINRCVIRWTEEYIKLMTSTILKSEADQDRELLNTFAKHRFNNNNCNVTPIDNGDIESFLIEKRGVNFTKA